MRPTPIEVCPDCGGDQGWVAHLPGDGTSCMEELWIPCQTCDPDYYAREGARRAVNPEPKEES